jgi:hypothetical protein
MQWRRWRLFNSAEESGLCKERGSLLDLNIVYESELSFHAPRRTRTYGVGLPARFKQVVKPFILEGDLSASCYGKQEILASSPKESPYSDDSSKARDWSWINPYGRWGERQVSQGSH